MSHPRRTAVATGIVLALAIGACGGGGQASVPLPVGTCVLVSDEGTATVPCAEPHTHRVSANVAGDGDACPRDTVMYSSPADPDDDPVTTCYAADATGE